jgi:hypothetical protein
MRYEKKQITKEDGRYLVYYHFSESATEEQAAVFRSVEETPPGGSASYATDPVAANLTENSHKEQPGV